MRMNEPPLSSLPLIPQRPRKSIEIEDVGGPACGQGIHRGITRNNHHHGWQFNLAMALPGTLPSSCYSAARRGSHSLGRCTALLVPAVPYSPSRRATDRKDDVQVTTTSDKSATGTIPGSGPVPFFSQAKSFEALWPLVSRHVHELMNRGKYSHGSKVAELEKALAAYTGARRAIAVNNGTDALVLLLRAAGIEPGDEVVVPAFTFAASATSVALARAKPVFADIDPVTYTIDPGSLRKVITPGTKAIMPVHLFCQMADMDAVTSIAAEHGVKVLEDSAEGIGMRWNGKHSGLVGSGGVLSFFPTKTLGALGDAGMILTDDPEIGELAQILRHHGRMGKTIDHIAGISNLSGISGTNSKMDDLQAAVLLAKLTRLEAEIVRRADLAAAYTERLAGVPGILRLPTVAERDAEADPVFYVYLIEAEDRDGLVEHLAARGIGTETYYPRPLHLQPAFAELGHGRGDFPNAEAATEKTLALPLYPDLTLDGVETVCLAIRDFYRGKRP
jgi:dTDP-4-amino-4,6-dideoxygalactose transaminase